MADAIAGHVDLVIGSAALITPLLKADLPTVAESGFPGSEGVVWWGIFTTAGTPRPIIERFRSELVTGLKNERVAKQLSETMQIKLTLDGPEYLRKFLSEQIRVWGAVVREHKVKMD